MKNFKSLNNDQQTLDSTYRNDNKTEMSEFNNNSNAIKMHKRYESHQNISSILKKNNDYYANAKSNVRIIYLFIIACSPSVYNS